MFKFPNEFLYTLPLSKMPPEKPNSNKQWKEPFIFIQGADCQLGMFQDYQTITKEPKWYQEIALTELAIKKINKMTPKPKFFVICGDLSHAFYDKMPEERAAQDVDLKRILSKLDPSIPMVCVCGNHDVGDSPTVDIISKYKSNYGDDYFSFHAGGVFFICINSQLYHNAPEVPQEVVAQERWLDDQLKIAKHSPTSSIMFQHVPWFLSDPENQEKNYFEIEPAARKRMLDKLIDAGVKHVFCGHYHRNAGGRYRGLECIVTSAIGYQLGTDKSGMRVVKVFRDRVEHQYYALEDLPSEVTL